MSKSGILDALRQEEQSRRTQLVAIQRAIEAIAGADAPATPVGRRSKQARKVVARPKRVLTAAQRKAIGERMRKYWAARRQAQAPEQGRTCVVPLRAHRIQSRSGSAPHAPARPRSPLAGSVRSGAPSLATTSGNRSRLAAGCALPDCRRRPGSATSSRKWSRSSTRRWPPSIRCRCTSSGLSQMAASRRSRPNRS